MNKMVEAFCRDISRIKDQHCASRCLAEFREAVYTFSKKWSRYAGIGDYLLDLGEMYRAEGDNGAGTVLLLAVAEHFPAVNNTTCFCLRLAEYCFENGNETDGIAYLVKLCNAVSNYEESIRFNDLTDVWLKYKHLVEGKVPASITVNSAPSPLLPEQCSLQIGELLALPREDILAALSAHLGELSANGEALNCLNQWEKTAYYADECCMEVNSGGFEGYLYYYGHHFEKARQAFEKLEATQMLSIWADIQEKFPRKRIPKTLDGIQNAMDKLEEADIDFEAEDSAYYGSAEKELLEKLLDYVLANRSHFR